MVPRPTADSLASAGAPLPSQRRLRRASDADTRSLEDRLRELDIANASSDSDRQQNMRVNRLAEHIERSARLKSRRRRSSLPGLLSSVDSKAAGTEEAEASAGDSGERSSAHRRPSLLSKRKSYDSAGERERRFRRRSVVVQPGNQPPSSASATSVTGSGPGTPAKTMPELPGPKLSAVAEQNATEAAAEEESSLRKAGRRASLVLANTGSEALVVMNTPATSPLTSRMHDEDKLTPYAGAAMGLASALLVGAITALGDSEVSRKVVVQLFGAAGGLVAAAAFMLWRGRASA